MAVGAPAPRESASTLAAATEASHPDLLALVSDHGTGSTEFSLLLNAHKCVFSIGEPFGGSEVNSYSHNTYWVSESGAESLYKPNGEPGDVTTNEKIATMTHLAASRVKKPAWDVEDLAPDFHLKEGASFDLSSYFSKLRAHVCKAMPQEDKRDCNGRCVLAFKMFPKYFGGYDDTYTLSQYASSEVQGKLALPEFLDDFLKSDKIAKAHIVRDERDRVHSNWARFDASKPAFYDTATNDTTTHNAFSCSSRKPTEWDQKARQGVDAHVNVEECWSTGEAYYQCMNKILSVVGLGVHDGKAESMKVDTDGKFCIDRVPSVNFKELNHKCNETNTEKTIEKHVECTSEQDWLKFDGDKVVRAHSP